MLRINLLPAYIAEQRKTRMAWVATGFGVAAVVGGLIGYEFAYLQPKVSEMTQQAQKADSEASAVEKLEQDAKNELAKIQPIQAKVTFVKGVQYFNLLVPQIYRNVARYTYNKVEYSSMNASGDTLTINAMVQDLSDVGRFYLTLFANPDITALSIKGMPGWPNATTASNPLPGEGNVNPDRGGFPLGVTAKLAQAVAPPAFAGAPAAAGGGMGGMMGAGGAPMMGGMMSGGMAGGMPGGAGGGSMGGSGGTQKGE
ncbi:MAG: PilN domain-containing protein [Armatimonadota bacterium]